MRLVQELSHVCCDAARRRHKTLGASERSARCCMRI
jgi:hypothetical protein